MQLSTKQAPTSRENEVWNCWYCRGCKRNVEVLCSAEAKTMTCPECGTLKTRFSDQEPKR